MLRDRIRIYRIVHASSVAASAFLLLGTHPWHLARTFLRHRRRTFLRHTYRLLAHTGRRHSLRLERGEEQQAAATVRPRQQALLPPQGMPALHPVAHTAKSRPLHPLPPRTQQRARKLAAHPATPLQAWVAHLSHTCRQAGHTCRHRSHRRRRTFRCRTCCFRSRQRRCTCCATVGPARRWRHVHGA